jgi:hypothetical protein
LRFPRSARVHRRARSKSPMPVSRIISVVFLLGLLAVPAQAAEVAPRACLNRTEQRAAVASHKAVPLAAAIKSLRERGHRAEVVRAALCNRGEKLVYVLTLLARSGKVTRATVDAANGEPINGQ